MVDETLVIDMQSHYIPSDALKLARKTEEYDFTYSIGRFVKAYQRMANIDAHLEWMENSGIDAIFVTQLQRTQQTAEPTATSLGLTGLPYIQYPITVNYRWKY